ncbi:GntP family permease [Gordonia terrae]|uniref:Gluconate transporter n=2 Tax=Gordonia terrae TaxID=2055 RepID=A0AAD0K901_9ACTN|nr:MULTISPECIES: gluconate:H+ symporter [Gordonia]VTR09145.1 high affinity gluconate/L-idonate permease [Clostridioides difficile]ANY21830.1 gluconate transporter [Gordonia terrae]AWO82562.1 gluconate transporter [Gordonia terrae]VTS21841.1 5-keto-D-gluconate transporter [Gordonia terrae]GAB44767.1 putative gluconate permease [Gordonia terrae NBRC 100016]
MSTTTTILAAGADLPEPVAPGWQLILAALAGIAVIVVAITIAKVHPFLALVGGGATVGIVAGESIPTVLESFTAGFGTTAAGVGILIALGAMFAKLLADSGGADEIVDTIVGHASPRMLPWAMALVGAIIGLPMFFEIGLVLLMPVIYLVARRSGLGLIPIGIPALAGLSAMHGFVPPHPGPLVAIDALGADLGMTLGLGVLVAIPTIIVSGPLFGVLAGKWVTVDAPTTFDVDPADGPTTKRPSFAITMFSVLLPVVLMLGKAIAEIFIADEDQPLRKVLDILGTPLIALLIAVIVAMFTLGRGSGMDRETISKCTGAALPAIAGILLIVSAGGGFKEVLVDTGIGTLLADWATGANVSVLLLAWTLAALIRLATGSATVATITASSLILGLVDGMGSGELSLVVLAIGAGSVFLSHVNDAGFWLVKEYFGMTVGQTFKTWSMMETVLSVTGLIVVLALGLVI